LEQLTLARHALRRVGARIVSGAGARGRAAAADGGVDLPHSGAATATTAASTTTSSASARAGARFADDATDHEQHRREDPLHGSDDFCRSDATTLSCAGNDQRGNPATRVEACNSRIPFTPRPTPRYVSLRSASGASPPNTSTRSQARFLPTLHRVAGASPSPPSLLPSLPAPPPPPFASIAPPPP